MRQRSGFTLVELSIVLVIVGVLIGGILVAQSMISTAKITNQIRQLSQFEAATNSFIAKYNALPGDSPLPTPPTLFSAFNSTTTHGNGIIETEAANQPCGGSNKAYSNECAYFFDNLSQSGMAGNYTAAVSADFHEYNFCGEGYAYPSAKLAATSEAGSACIYVSQNPSNDLFWIIARNQRMDSDGAYDHTRALTAAQALAIDSKIDDGKALTGNVVMSDSFGALSTSGDYGSTKYAESFWHGPADASGSWELNCITDPVSGQYNAAGTVIAGYLATGCNLQIKANIAR